MVGVYAYTIVFNKDKGLMFIDVYPDFDKWVGLGSIKVTVGIGDKIIEDDDEPVLIAVEGTEGVYFYYFGYVKGAGDEFVGIKAIVYYFFNVNAGRFNIEATILGVVNNVFYKAVKLLYALLHVVKVLRMGRRLVYTGKLD